jgi:hypothetical protein
VFTLRCGDGSRPFGTRGTLGVFFGTLELEYRTKIYSNSAPIFE